jgi:hypothetical protein
MRVNRSEHGIECAPLEAAWWTEKIENPESQIEIEKWIARIRIPAGNRCAKSPLGGEGPFSIVDLLFPSSGT